MQRHCRDCGGPKHGHPEAKHRLIERRVGAENPFPGNGHRPRNGGIEVTPVVQLILHRAVVKISVIGRHRLGGKNEQDDFPRNDQRKNQPGIAVFYEKGGHYYFISNTLESLTRRNVLRTNRATTEHVPIALQDGNDVCFDVFPNVMACQWPMPLANCSKMVGKQQMPPSAAHLSEKVPLCVDLDGTLIKTDVLWESLMLLLKRNPLFLMALPFWLLPGRAFLKQQIAARTELNPAALPYHPAFLDFLREERRRGRKLVLTTAADSQVAQRVAQHVGLFSEVIASNGETNLRGGNKGRKLVERFGKQGFDYAGNSTVDLPVWREARAAIVVNADERLAQKARQLGEVSHIFNERKSYAGAFIKELRPHQWV